MYGTWYVPLDNTSEQGCLRCFGSIQNRLNVFRASPLQYGVPTDQRWFFFFFFFSGEEEEGDDNKEEENGGRIEEKGVGCLAMEWSKTMTTA